MLSTSETEIIEWNLGDWWRESVKIASGYQWECLNSSSGSLDRSWWDASRTPGLFSCIMCAILGGFLFFDLSKLTQRPCHEFNVLLNVFSDDYVYFEIEWYHRIRLTHWTAKISLILGLCFTYFPREDTFTEKEKKYLKNEKTVEKIQKKKDNKKEKIREKWESRKNIEKLK